MENIPHYPPLGPNLPSITGSFYEFSIFLAVFYGRITFSKIKFKIWKAPLHESSSKEEVDLRKRRNEVIHRMAPFYANRNDIFHIFNDEQVSKVFRFDKPTIYYIGW